MSENKKPSLKNINSKSAVPSKLELETLIDYYKRGLYNNAVKLAPQNPQIHLNIGIILKALGRLNEAEKAYRQVITLKPNSAEAYNNLGNTLEELSHFENAEVSFKKAIALKPNYA